MADNIGRWARRLLLATGKPLTRSHRVESERAGRFVMNCGREMAYRADQPWEFSDEQPADGCYWCVGPVTVVVE